MALAVNRTRTELPTTGWIQLAETHWHAGNKKAAIGCYKRAASQEKTAGNAKNASDIAELVRQLGRV